MRNRFDEELELLNTELIHMGSLCEEAIADLILALRQGNHTLAQKIRDGGSEIDQMERDIEQRCMKLLLHQQPVARDLRKISAALKMITDMERIGDQAEDIAEIILFLNGRKGLDITKLMDMAAAAAKMVTDSVTAYVRKDAQLAKMVLDYDDVVDDFFREIKYTIMEWIRTHPEEGEEALDFLMIAKYFERIGDHATNIAEWVIYAVTGRHKGELP